MQTSTQYFKEFMDNFCGEFPKNITPKDIIKNELRNLNYNAHPVMDTELDILADYILKKQGDCFGNWHVTNYGLDSLCSGLIATYPEQIIELRVITKGVKVYE